jgi:hypothetical protein
MMKILHLSSLLLVSIFSRAQGQVELFGRVLGEEGHGFPGVNIVIKGTSVGTITNACGEFKIIVPQNRECILAFSAISQPVYFNLRKLKSEDLNKEIRFWMFRYPKRKRNVNLNSTCDLSRAVKVCDLTYK